MFKIGNLTIEIKNIILPIIYIITGILIYKLIKKILTKITTKTKINIRESQKQKLNTIRTLILNIVKYVIVIIILLACLSLYGINISSILAGLGITTALIGLAFQDLAKDLIAGFSIISENQYEIGDVIEVDGFKGEVEFLGLKTTRIKNYKGAVKIIANRNMDKIINYSLHNSLAEVEISVDYNADLDKVEKVLKELNKLDIPYKTKDIEINGIINLDDSAIIYKVSQETQANKQVIAERYIRRKIKDLFDKNNIDIPYPQVVIHNEK